MDSSERRTISYDNSFNKTSLSLLTQVQTDVLMSILSRMGETQDEEGRFVADYHFKDIREMTEIKELYTTRLKKALDDILNTKVEFFTENEYYKGNLFSNYYLTKKNEVRITLSTDMTKKVLLNKGNYTVLNLDEYVSLSNRHSKELYRLLRQFRYLGMLIIKKEDLIRLLNPPKSYDEYNFIQKALMKAIEDNKKYFPGLKLINLTGKGNSLPKVCKFSFEKHEKSPIKDIIQGKNAEETELLKYIMENGGNTKKDS